jgi:DNA-binding transcriptional LysR family regulator
VNLQQLTTFCKVISEGSMTAAADKLFLTQPAVSQQIRALEDELGVPLLVRGVRQVKPSMQGQLLYEYAKKILHLTQQAEVAIHTISQELAGELKIGTTNAFGLHLISPVVGLFLKHNTKLSLKLVYGSADQIVNEMRKGTVDMTILPDLKNEFGVEFDKYEEKFLFSDEMWLVGSSKDASLPEKISISEINTRPVVVDSATYPNFRRMLQQKLDAGKLQLKPVFETDNVGTLKRVIEAGVGWGFLPSHSIKKQVRTRRLSQVHVDELKYAVNVNLYSLKLQGIRQMADVIFRAIQQQNLNG